MDVLSVPTFFTPKNPGSKPHKSSSSLRRSSLRRSSTRPPLKTSSPVGLHASVRRPKSPTNPLKNSSNTQISPHSNPLASKLWLSSKICPPPPPPSPSPPTNGTPEHDPCGGDSVQLPSSSTTPDYRQNGKIFVGNLPLWIKKNEIVEFFRQFGPVKNVVLIKGHEDPERNVGYCFLIYGGPTAGEAAVRAVEFDGVEFHGRVLTVRLDDGSRMRAREEERAKLVAGGKSDFRSKWHEERDAACRRFRKVLDTEPKNWQDVVSAFERISKPSRREFGLMVNYYARRGDKHHARATFENMRARGIEPNSYVFTNLVHAYAVARDMRGALSCIEEMRSEGIELTLVTYSILIGGYANINDAESADKLFTEAKQKLAALNSVIYSNIIYANCQSGNMSRAEVLVREMEEQGIDAPIDLYHTMMDGYTNVLNEEKCLVIFERLKECNFSPSVISYGCLINLYTKFGKMSKAVDVSKIMESCGIRHNSKTYSMLINGFIQLDDYANAFNIFEEMLKSGLKPDAVVYNIIINAFCKMGNMDRAVCLVDEMQKERHKPSSRTFRPIIYGFATAGDTRSALDIFDLMRRLGCIPTVETYNVLILGLARKHQMKKAVGIIDKMILAGISPNEHTYTTIMEGYAADGDTGKAFEYFTKIKEAGLKVDVFTYESLLKACCKSGRMQSALAVTREMSTQRIPQNTFIYNILIDGAIVTAPLPTIMEGYAADGDTGKEFEYFTKIKEAGLKVDVFTYESLLKACCKSGRMQSALAVNREMSTQRIPQNTFIYNILIDGAIVTAPLPTIMEGYAADGDTGKEFEYFTKIKEAGLKVDVFTYESLLKACCKSGRMQSALAVNREMSTQRIPQNTFIYNILIDGWARRGDVWEAADLIQHMKLDGVLPDIHTYTSFINACCKAGDMQKAINVMKEMVSAGIKPNIKTYTTLIRGWARASLPEKALMYFEEMKSTGLKPDNAAYHCLLTSLLSRSTLSDDRIYSEILNICQEMVDRELTVDMGTAVHWSKCLLKIERAGGELTEALQKTFPPAWILSKNACTSCDEIKAVDAGNNNIYEDDDFHKI